MLKSSHVKFAILITVPFITKETFSCLFLSMFAAIAPDFDLKLKIRHRTWTHSLITYGIVSLLIYMWDFNTFFFFSLGYLSHILLDTLTVNGVKLFYPYYRSYGFRLIRTGATAEKVINALFTVALVLMFIYLVIGKT